MDLVILIIGIVLLSVFVFIWLLCQSYITTKDDCERTIAIVTKYAGIETKDLRIRIDDIIEGKVDASADEVNELVVIMLGKKAKKGELFYEEDERRLEHLAKIMIKKNKEES